MHTRQCKISNKVYDTISGYSTSASYTWSLECLVVIWDAHLDERNPTSEAGSSSGPQIPENVLLGHFRMTNDQIMQIQNGGQQWPP